MDNESGARRILTARDVEVRTGTKNAQRRTMEARGEFPERIQITKFRVGYYEDEIARWIDSRPRGKTAVVTPRSPGRLGKRVSPQTEPEAA